MSQLSSAQAAKKALHYFATDHNCAESVLHVMQQAYDLEESVLGAASGFGGGIGRSQVICGAISGGVIAIGLQSARGIGDRKKARDRALRRARELFLGFRDEFGSTDCRTLTGHDFGSQEEFGKFLLNGTKQHKCTKFVGFVVRKLVAQED